MRKLIILFLILSSFVGRAQVYQAMPQYGYGPVKRMDIDSSLTIPTTCGVPSLRTTLTKKAAVAYDSCNKRFYYYDPKLMAWDTIKGGGGSSTDTTSLSNRINNKVDSVTKSNDSVRYWKNGSSFFAFRDVSGGQNGRWGNDTALIVLAKVRNVTGTTMTRGTVVMLNGATGDVASVIRANNKYDSTSARTIGVVKDPIAAGDTGWVVTQGQASKLNLGAFTEGDVLYLDSLDGGLTKTKPVAPYHGVFVGIVERANNGNGLLYTKPLNGYELGELHDVRITSPINNQVLVYSDTQDIWKNRNVYSVVDTTKLSARIDLRVRYSDTASMLSPYQRSISAMKYSDSATMLTPYLRKTDTASLSNRINLRLLISDTATMLSDYTRKLTTDTMRTNIYSTLNGKLNISDSSTYQTKFRTDTMRTNIYNQLAQEVNLSDSNTIYSTKFRVDTMRTNVYSAINGKQNTLTNPVTGTGTSGSLTKFSGTSTVTNAVVDVDYMQQDMSMVAMQAMGSSIKGYNIFCPILNLITTSANMTSGNLGLQPIYLPKAQTITGALFYQATQGVYTANNYNGVALYSVSGGTLTLVASSTNDGNIWKATSNTWQTKAFSSPYSAAAGLYYLGYIYSNSAQTTAPALGATPLVSNSAIRTFDFTNSLRILMTLTSQTALPNSITASTAVGGTGGFPIYLY